MLKNTELIIDLSRKNNWFEHFDQVGFEINMLESMGALEELLKKLESK